MAGSAAKTMKVMYGVVCLLFFAGILGTAGFMLYQNSDKTLKEWKDWSSQASRPAGKNWSFAGPLGKTGFPIMNLPVRPRTLGAGYQANAIKEFQKVQDAINASGDSNRIPGLSSNYVNPIPGVNNFSAGGSIRGPGATLPRSTRP
jgi:hypothetical protein